MPSSNRTTHRRNSLIHFSLTLFTSPTRCGRRAFERACLEVAGLEAALAAISLGGATDPWILEEAFRGHRQRSPTAEEAAAVLAAYLVCLAEEVRAAGAVEV